jgi:ribosome-binding factor A
MKKKSHQPGLHEDPLCAKLREDDGLPPSVWAKRQRIVHRHINYHGEQLCKQVRIALADAIACDCADPSFEDLQVLDVRMKSGTSALEVIVAAPPQDPVLLSGISQRLQSAEGLLRAAIGASICRKRLPSLRFRLVPASN